MYFGSAYPHEQTTTAVVFFLGGCTYTEIAAIRWVGRQNRGKRTDAMMGGKALMLFHPGRKFLIATTGLISGGGMVESISGVGKSGVATREAGL
jgi:hypothetical protein